VLHLLGSLLQRRPRLGIHAWLVWRHCRRYALLLRLRLLLLQWRLLRLLRRLFGLLRRLLLLTLSCQLLRLFTQQPLSHLCLQPAAQH
jgi:hypothetical protein